MRISDDVIQQVRDNNDIIEVLGEYLTFKKNGENFLSRCPFHSEKTPSFVASRNKQIFKCFGCGETGNVISFIMKYKNLNFVESIEFLGKRIGIDINRNLSNSNNYIYYNILIEAAKYFYINLKKNTNIRRYLINRGLNDKVIVKFGLGYSLNSFDSLKKYLLSRGFLIKDLLDIGLVNFKNGRYYDKFINRIMFPIFNNMGKVIGFGGRVIDDSQPKYLNSKESEVFKKGNNLYGLNFILKENRHIESLIIVEGYMDCIALYNFGISNVVACLGTAFTSNHCKIISKYSKKVYLCFDSDSAGINAIVKTFDIFKEFITSSTLEVYVVELNDSKDPDEFLNKYGKDEFLKAVDRSKDLIEFILTNFKLGFDLESKQGKKNYLNKVSNIMEQLEFIDRDYYLNKVAKDLHIKNEVLLEYINKKNKVNNEEYSLSDFDIFVEKAYIKAEKQILFLMLKKEYLNYILNNNVDESLFYENIHKNIFRKIINLKESDENILELLERDFKTYDEIKTIIYFKENGVLDDNINIISQIDDYIDVLRKNRLRNFKMEITHIIKKYEFSGDDVEANKYLNVFNSVLKLEKEEKILEAIEYINMFKV